MLTNFDLVNTDGLKGLNFNGDYIPFDKIDDAMAEKLEGKTHVLKRKAVTATANLPQLAPAAEVVTTTEVPVNLEMGTAPAEAEAPTTRRRANS
jgi:hypothetical protein